MQELLWECPGASLPPPGTPTPYSSPDATGVGVITDCP